MQSIGLETRFGLNALLFYSIFCLLLISTGCGGSNPETDHSTSNESTKSGTDLSKPVTKVAASQTKLFHKMLARDHKHVKYFDGTVAGEAVRMALFFEPEPERNAEQSVFGYYYYQSQEAPLALHGNYNPKTGSLRLAEYDLNAIKDPYGEFFIQMKWLDGESFNFVGKLTAGEYTGNWFGSKNKKYTFKLVSEKTPEPWLSVWRIKNHGVLYVVGPDGEAQEADSWDGTGMAFTVYKEIHFMLIKNKVFLFTSNNELTHSWTGHPVFLIKPVQLTKNNQIELDFRYKSGNRCQITYTISGDSIRAIETEESRCLTNYVGLTDPDAPMIRIYPGYGGTFYPLP